MISLDTAKVESIIVNLKVFFLQDRLPALPLLPSAQLRPIHPQPPCRVQPGLRRRPQDHQGGQGEVRGHTDGHIQGEGGEGRMEADILSFCHRFFETIYKTYLVYYYNEDSCGQSCLRIAVVLLDENTLEEDFGKFVQLYTNRQS